MGGADAEEAVEKASAGCVNSISNNNNNEDDDDDDESPGRGRGRGRGRGLCMCVLWVLQPLLAKMVQARQREEVYMILSFIAAHEYAQVC